MTKPKINPLPAFKALPTPTDKPSLDYMLKRIKVHLPPDLAEAAFRPNEAMDEAIAELREIAEEARRYGNGTVFLDEREAVLNGRHLARAWADRLVPREK